MRRSVAANMPIRIAFLRCPSGSPAAASPMTIALSPASTRSIMMTWKSAVRCCEEINSSIRATPFLCSNPTSQFVRTARGARAWTRTRKRSQSGREKLFPLLRLIREGEEPDELIRFDQNGQDAADESKAAGQVEPHEAESVAPADQGEGGRHGADRKQKGDNSGRQCIRRHHVPDCPRRGQRHQQDPCETVS